MYLADFFSAAISAALAGIRSILLLLLSTHADRQGVDISVCLFVCLFVRLRISPARIKLAASNFARWFTGVLGRESLESLILGNFAPPQAQNRPANRRSASGRRIGMCG